MLHSHEERVYETARTLLPTVLLNHLENDPDKSNLSSLSATDFTQCAEIAVDAARALETMMHNP